MLPGAIVLGIGLTLLVAPLTASVLAAIEDRHAGVGSAINNAVSRVAGLLAVAVIPAVAGIAGGAGGLDLSSGFDTAMFITAGLCAIGAVVAFVTVRSVKPIASHRRADVSSPCEHPCLAEAS